MPKTVAQLKAEIARVEKSWRIGMWVRVKGWQMHWPEQIAQIVEIHVVRGEAKLSKPILGRKIWPLAELSPPF